MLKNLYIRKGDEPFWERAQEAADNQRVALSVWVSDLVRTHFYDVGSGRKDDELTVDEMLADIEAKTDRIRGMLKS